MGRTDEWMVMLGKQDAIKEEILSGIHHGQGKSHGHGGWYLWDSSGMLKRWVHNLAEQEACGPGWHAEPQKPKP